MDKPIIKKGDLMKTIDSEHRFQKKNCTTTAVSYFMERTFDRFNKEYTVNIVLLAQITAFESGNYNILFNKSSQEYEGLQICGSHFI